MRWPSQYEDAETGLYYNRFRYCDPKPASTPVRQPGGWVYEIAGDFGPDDAVPPAAIRGAWKVDDDGQIIGDFVPNLEFRPGQS